MSEQPESREIDIRQREALSALLDGHAAPAELARACAAWRDDPQARAGWHAYALIGDVMRSDELAAAGRRDAALIKALREQWAVEPVPLPVRTAAAVLPRRMAALAAVIAGFVLVAGAAIMLRQPAEPAAGPMLASNSPGASEPLVAASVERDRRIDRYFEAHRQQSIRRAALSDSAEIRPVDAVVTGSR